MGDKGGEVHFFPFLIENEKENGKKYFVHYVGNLSRIPKLFFFHSSIKTEEVLLFYICIYIKNYALNGKFFRNKVFFDFTYCVKISVRSDR